MPELRHDHGRYQLLVRGRPFLILGGELGNSTASDPEGLRAIWPRLVAMNLNTVLLPVYWELVEPEQGQFAFELVDLAIEEARSSSLHLILLWFGSWKNSMSCYVPGWVKQDTQRFPRARLRSGRAVEILSAFHEENWAADARAFAALLSHLRQVDAAAETVIMVQVENEVGMLEDARDHGEMANQAFSDRVPDELLEQLDPGCAAHQAWCRAGRRSSGSWVEVFGDGLATDEIFMAWHYASYTNRVARAGLSRYPLPMFVNAALNRPGHLPGQYPSAGPLPHLFDLWRAGAPEVACLAPDIYLPDFTLWCERYHRPNNPLFIPEAVRSEDSAVHALYAVGRHTALGYSPFAIEKSEPGASEWLARSYQILRQLAPMLLAPNARCETAGILVDREQPQCEIALGDSLIRAVHDFTWEWSEGHRSEGRWPRFGGLVIATGASEFLIAGRGLILTFAPNSPGAPSTGILSIDEGEYDADGRWIPGRRLNGDESHQGRHVRLPPDRISIQRVRLYRYG